MERYLARGMEHNVLSSKSGREYVFKRPRLRNILSFIKSDPVTTIREELRVSQESLAGTDVRIPRTKILRAKPRIFGRTIPINGYVIGQEYIREDKSVTDIDQRLKSQGLGSLAEEYKHEPRNFISKDGVVYWIDPTKGVIGRVLENLGIAKLEDYRRLRARLSKVIRFFGL